MTETSEASGESMVLPPNSCLPSLTKRYVEGREYSPTSAKDNKQHIEQIRTNERVPGDTHYYEKDGSRTHVDGENHVEPPMTFKRIMSLIAMAFRKPRTYS